MQWVWLTLSLGSVLSAIFPHEIGVVGKHGKMNSTIEKSSSKLLQTYTNLVVPKSWFIYFYVVGILGCLARSSQQLFLLNGARSLTWVMFTFQCGRRLIECLHTLYGDSTMHGSAFLLGFLHYYLIPIEIKSIPDERVSLAWFALVGGLFLIASFSQNYCHRILDGMKRNQGKSKTYKVPRGFLFEFVCCPHYLCEVMVYLCLWLMNPASMEMFLIFVWVLSNHIVVADFQFEFYQRRATTSLPPHWKRLVPFIW